jgi:hypothetical protein
VKKLLKRLAEKVLILLARLIGQEIAKYQGEVLDASYPGGDVQIGFNWEGKRFTRVFPKERVEAIKAAFETAKVQYIVYELGAVRISILRYIGPSYEELRKEEMVTLSEEELKILDEW